MTVSSPATRIAAVVALTALAAGRLTAAPRDEVLRLAPPDAAIVVLVQDARAHAENLNKSPFAEWFPQSALGKQLFAGVNLKQFQTVLDSVFAELNVPADELFNDAFGDAVAFAYSPPPTADPKGERAVLLIRPRKPDTLSRVVDRLNELQKRSGEVKEVVRRSHHGEVYFERRKPAGPSEFYCFRGGVFAFSGTEPDIRAVIDRDRAAADGRPPELSARLAKLGVADALAVVLVNPRALDAELRAKVAAARPDEQPFLERFAEVWAATDAAAVYLALGRDLEVGVSLDFRPEALPPAARGWLTGARTPSPLGSAIPDDALFALTARFQASVLLDTIGSLLPPKGKVALDAAVADTLGPVVGRDKLPVVLDALGPDWAVWAEPPPAGGGSLPVFVGAVRVQGEGAKGKQAARAIVQSVEFGFQAVRVAYNASHTDQIELQEEDDGGVVITSLVNDKGFPPGFRPSFALKGGYLVVATSPDAIKRFRPPSSEPATAGEAVVVRFSGTATRAYLQAHRQGLAKFLADTGGGKEKDLLKQLDQFAAALEPVDRLELVTRGTDTGLRLAVRVTFVKPLKR